MVCHGREDMHSNTLSSHCSESGSTAFIETEFVAEPTSQTVVAGMTAEFECFTTGR